MFDYVLLSLHGSRLAGHRRAGRGLVRSDARLFVVDHWFCRSRLSRWPEDTLVFDGRSLGRALDTATGVDYLPCTMSLLERWSSQGEISQRGRRLAARRRQLLKRCATDTVRNHGVFFNLLFK